MPYIPKEHEKYDLLPNCRKNGGEVFDYPSDLIYEVEEMLGASSGIFPYNYDSYDEYFGCIDRLLQEHNDNDEIVSKLIEVRNAVKNMNQKEQWSVLRYVGPTDNADFGLTKGKNYYWPTRADNPIYCGVIDDEEFTAYLYPTEPHLWEILEDPTGMAHRTLFENGKGYLSQAQHDSFMEQIKQQFADLKE